MKNSPGRRNLPSLARFVTILLLVVAGPLCAAPASFEAANALFDQQKYAEARDAYLSLDQSGLRTSNLAYNLGNAEYRLAAPGRAIWHYERALRRDPAHAEARANLAFVRGQTGSQTLQAHWADRLVPAWPTSILVILAALGGWLVVFGVAAFLLRIIRPPGGWRGGSANLILIVGVLLTAWTGVVLWRLQRQEALAITLDAVVEARTAPADGVSLVAPFPAGSQVRILGERGAWSYCELPGDRRGWLHTSALGRVSPSFAS